MVTQSDNDVRGTFYIVATPIGNLDDFTDRAKRVLQEVDFIAAEDTRHSKRLMNHFGIETRYLLCTTTMSETKPRTLHRY